MNIRSSCCDAEVHHGICSACQCHTGYVRDFTYDLGITVECLAKLRQAVSEGTTLSTLQRTQLHEALMEQIPFDVEKGSLYDYQPVHLSLSTGIVVIRLLCHVNCTEEGTPLPKDIRDKQTIAGLMRQGVDATKASLKYKPTPAVERWVQRELRGAIKSIKKFAQQAHTSSNLHVDLPRSERRILSMHCSHGKEIPQEFVSSRLIMLRSALQREGFSVSEWIWSRGDRPQARIRW